jgi:hypothetical protein
MRGRIRETTNRTRPLARCPSQFGVTISNEYLEDLRRQHQVDLRSSPTAVRRAARLVP